MFPVGGDPASIPQTTQGRIERPVFHLKDILRAALDGVGDGLAIGGTKHECREDEHVQGPLDHFGLEGHWCPGMFPVDARLVSACL